MQLFAESLFELEARFEEERASLSDGAHDPELAAHQGNELPADRKPEPRAAMLACRRRVGLREWSKDAFHPCFGNALAGVGHPDFEIDVPGTSVADANSDDDLALLGELEGVAEEIGDDLPQAERVTADFRRDFGSDMGDELDALGLSRRSVVHGDFLGHRNHVEWHGFESHFAGIDFREVEQVVDDREERTARLVDFV